MPLFFTLFHTFSQMTKPLTPANKVVEDRRNLTTTTEFLEKPGMIQAISIDSYMPHTQFITKPMSSES